ncbi:MAG: site-specific DNA-methyltransferase [Methanothrix sp.]
MTEKKEIIVSGEFGRMLGDLVPAEVLLAAQDDMQKAIPALAKDLAATKAIEKAIKRVPTQHRLILGDSRHMDDIEDESVHLVVTSPPYWTLKEYPVQEGQLGRIGDYEQFLENLDHVWKNALRVLVKGGRLVVVVGDVCLPRRNFGRHVVFPLHAGIQEHCRKIGFDNLAPIIWHKISNANFESSRCTNFLGKPYEPNAIVKNDIEYILFQRKPGGYRQPTSAARLMSIISENSHRIWFQQIWDITGASTKLHPAPYPLALAERLIRMFSFVGDTVLDPFMGTGTTNLAAGLWGRNSIGYEIEPAYFELACRRARELKKTQLTLDAISFVDVKQSCQV